MATLNTDIRYIKGVGEARAKSLAKLGITETGVRNQLKKATIKPGTLAKYADALSVQIVDKREFVLLPAETENALVDEALTKREYTDEEIANWAWVNELEERPIPRALTEAEIESARKDWEAEQRTGIAEAIVQSERE